MITYDIRFYAWVPGKEEMIKIVVDVGRYDLLGIILVALSKKIVKDGCDELRLHRLLGAIFSPDLTVHNKKEILSKEFKIELTTDMERSFDHMCNLSEAIEEQGIQKGIQKGEIKALSKLVNDGTLSVEQAALTAKITVVQFYEKVQEYGFKE